MAQGIRQFLTHEQLLRRPRASRMVEELPPASRRQQSYFDALEVLRVISADVLAGRYSGGNGCALGG